jgi:co-chaperonin GroES (HSP10)
MKFTLTGTMPFLMHADDVESSDTLQAWRKDPANKNLSVKGDDRSPAWTWQTYCYPNDGVLGIPSANIMVSLRKAAAQLILKGKTTYKEVSQSGLLIADEYCEFRSNGEVVSVESLKKLRDKTFSEQAAGVKKLGFKLFVKRAAVGQAKHVRVRARFESWSVSGKIQILVPEITPQILSQLFEIAGRGGLGDWRPACKTPGPFGMFSAVVK